MCCYHTNDQYYNHMIQLQRISSIIFYQDDLKNIFFFNLLLVPYLPSEWNFRWNVRELTCSLHSKSHKMCRKVFFLDI